MQVWRFPVEVCRVQSGEGLKVSGEGLKVSGEGLKVSGEGLKVFR